MLFTEINFKVVGITKLDIDQSAELMLEVTVRPSRSLNDVFTYNHRIPFDISDSGLNQYIDYVAHVLKRELALSIQNNRSPSKKEIENQIDILLSEKRLQIKE